jgi:hypothetical protein
MLGPGAVLRPRPPSSSPPPSIISRSTPRASYSRRPRVSLSSLAPTTFVSLSSLLLRGPLLSSHPSTHTPFPPHNFPTLAPRAPPPPPPSPSPPSTSSPSTSSPSTSPPPPSTSSHPTHARLVISPRATLPEFHRASCRKRAAALTAPSHRSQGCGDVLSVPGIGAQDQACLGGARRGNAQRRGVERRPSLNLKAYEVQQQRWRAYAQRRPGGSGGHRRGGEGNPGGAAVRGGRGGAVQGSI